MFRCQRRQLGSFRSITIVIKNTLQRAVAIKGVKVQSVSPSKVSLVSWLDVPAGESHLWDAHALRIAQGFG